MIFMTIMIIFINQILRITQSNIKLSNTSIMIYIIRIIAFFIHCDC